MKSYLLSSCCLGILLSTQFVLSQPLLAQECDLGLALDWNCDGKQVVAILGDSFVAGVGDKNEKTLHGYIGRSAKALPKISILGFGTKGQDTGQLLSEVKDALEARQSSELQEVLLTADVVVLDIGRNDRWLFGPPSDALSNLKEIRTLIQSEVRDETGIAPVVVLAVLMLPNRGAQGPWVAELNKLIFKSHKVATPANLRFDLVSKRLIGADQIHPTSRGYVELSKTFVSYLKKNLPGLLRKMKKAAAQS